MAEIYRGRVRVATVNLQGLAGSEIGVRYGAGAGSLVVLFDLHGQPVEYYSSPTVISVREALDRLLAAQ